MWKPNESLDEFVVKAVPEELAEPPRPVSLRFTGEVEVLKPLADQYVRHTSQWLLWFRRSLAVAGGGLAMAAFIFASAIFVGIYDQPVQQSGEIAEVASDDVQPEEILVPAEEPLASDSFTTTSSALVFDERDAVRSIARPRTARPRVQPAAYRPSRVESTVYRQQPQSYRSQLVVSAFIPTTLVIYIENGEIKTRIEPQLIAINKKPQTLSN